MVQVLQLLQQEIPIKQISTGTCEYTQGFTSATDYWYKERQVTAYNPSDFCISSE